MNALVKVLTKKHINFVAVKQMCSHCGHQQLWKSQPHIRDTPAAAAILLPPSQYIQHAVYSLFGQKQYEL